VRWILIACLACSLAAQTNPILRATGFTGTVEFRSNVQNTGTTRLPPAGEVVETWRQRTSAKFNVQLSKDATFPRSWRGRVTGPVLVDNENIVLFVTSQGACTSNWVWSANQPLFSAQMTLDVDSAGQIFTFYVTPNKVRTQFTGSFGCPGMTGFPPLPAEDDESPFAPDLQRAGFRAPVPPSGTPLSSQTIVAGEGGVGGLAAALDVFQYDVIWNLTATIPPEEPEAREEETEDECRQAGSSIGCFTQSLGEAIALTGVDFRLHYQSNRVRGYRGAAIDATAVGLGGWMPGNLHVWEPALKTLLLGDGESRGSTSVGDAKAVDGNLLVASAEGREIYVFSASGRHLRTQDALTGAALRSFEYDSAGRLMSVTDEAGNRTALERDAAGRPVAVVSPYGHRNVLQLDSNGYLASVSNPNGETYRMTYAAGGLLATFTDPRGNAARMTYDANGRLLQDQNALSKSQTLVRSGSEVSHTSAGGLLTRYIQEAAGNTRRRIVVAPTGLRSEFTAAGSDQTLVLPDAVQRTAKTAADPRWGLSAAYYAQETQRTPGGLAREIRRTREATLADSRNPFSLARLAESETQNEAQALRAYAASGRLLTETSASGVMSVTRLDERGRPVEERTGRLAPVRISYDSRGRVAALSQGADPRTTGFEYNSGGWLARETDAIGRITQYEYDRAGRTIAAALPGNRTLRAGYDAAGSLTTLTTPSGARHEFSYTPLNQLAAHTLPGGAVLRYVYDGDRRLTRLIRAAAGLAPRARQSRPAEEVIELRRDRAGRVEQITAGRTSARYEYDAKTGLLAAIRSANGVALSLSYDGHLPVKAAWSGPYSGSVEYAYNSDFRVRQITVNGGAPVDYVYDRGGLLVQAGDLRLVRSPETGQILSTEAGRVKTVTTYNEFGEVSSWRAEAGSELLRFEYERDRLGRIVALTEALEGRVVRYQYRYDEAARLSSVERDGAIWESYAWDANGNRLSIATPGGALEASYDEQDRIRNFGGSQYSFTASGRLVQVLRGGGRLRLDSDPLENLLAADLPDGVKIEYLADGRNRRVARKAADGSWSFYLYQDDLRVAAETDRSGAVRKRFVHAEWDNTASLLIRDGAVYRILTDHLGSPRLVVSIETGNVAQRLAYSPFGKVLEDSNPGFQPFGFAGGLWDADTGLVRMGAREYDAETGRWTARDPIGFRGGDVNLYSYAGADPVNRRDSDGLQVRRRRGQSSRSSSRNYRSRVCLTIIPEGITTVEESQGVSLTLIPEGITTVEEPAVTGRVQRRLESPW
jgi:RHS repeat-associated protein